MTVGSFVELAGSVVLYAGGAAALLVLASFVRRGSRVAMAVAAGAVCMALIVLVVRPEFVRSHLDLAYAWIPAGAAVAAVALAWRAHRSRCWTAADQIALLCRASSRCSPPRPTRPSSRSPTRVAQFAIYALPFAAVFLVWLHLRGAPARRPHRCAARRACGSRVLAGWSAALVAHDARDESHGARAGRRDDRLRPPRSAYQEAIDRIVAAGRPGDPILLAPQLSALYILTGRTDPLPQLSPASRHAGDGHEEREAIAPCATCASP